ILQNVFPRRLGIQALGYLYPFFSSPSLNHLFEPPLHRSSPTPPRPPRPWWRRHSPPPSALCCLSSLPVGRSLSKEAEQLRDCRCRMQQRKGRPTSTGSPSCYIATFPWSIVVQLMSIIGPRAQAMAFM
ncbi:hypothetical protein HPP92_014222, partial [Vanilla planifolia]